MQDLELKIWMGFWEQADSDHARTMLFGSMMERALGMRASSPVESAMVGTTVLTVLHAAYRHPEWFQAVIKETQFLTELSTPEVFEKALLEITQYWPIIRREVAPDYNH